MANQNFLEVILKGDNTQLVQSLNQAQSKITKFSTGLKNIGSTLTRNVTLPLSLAGGAAVKMAMDFDQSMTKIQALVGLSADEVDSMRQSVIDLAKDTGQSAGAAADALFFITSAGLEGSEAMDVLEASLKASSSGLGDVATVADAATSAMNAYGSDTLSASQATDVLVAAVREGKLESTELAGAIGQVIPIASNMGVTFDEVGAVLAGMSRTGTNAATASMQLKNILTSILKPSKEGADALNSMGLSSAKLQQIIQEDGLLAMLQLLKTAFENNGDAQQKVFGNTRALMGIMDLLGKGADQTAEIFHELANATGATEKAFEDTAGSPSFQLKDAINDVKNSLTEIGTEISKVVVPMIRSLSTVIVFLTDKFKSASPTMKTIIVSLTALAALAGPLLYLGGTVLPMLATGFKVASSAMTLLIANPVIAGVTALTVAFTILARKVDKVFSEGRVGTLKTMKNMLLSFGNATKFAQLQAVDYSDALNTQEDAEKSIADEMAETAQAVADAITKSQTLTDAYDGVTNGTRKLTTAVGYATKGIIDMSERSLKPAADVLTSFTPKLFFANSLWQEAGQQLIPQFGQALSASFASIGEGENPLKRLITTLKALMVRLLAAAAAAFILSAALPKMFGGDSTKKGAGFFDALSMLTGMKFETFAKGGIISGPTFGLMGEYAGARNNPEVVAPLNKLESLIGNKGNAVTGEFVLRGQDLVVALQRAERNRNRII